jgi:hypothetical protein
MVVILSLEHLATWAGIVLPLSVLAWSAWQYVAIRKREEARARFDRLFHLLGLLGGDENTSVYSKVGAIYELRNFPEYGPVVLRICTDSKSRIKGELAFMMENEFQATIDYLKKKK